MSWLSRILRRRPEPISFQGARVNLHCWWCGKQIVGAHTSLIKSGNALRVHNECREAAVNYKPRLILEDAPQAPTPIPDDVA